GSGTARLLFNRTDGIQLVSENASLRLVRLFHYERTGLWGVNVEVAQRCPTRSLQPKDHPVWSAYPIKPRRRLPGPITHKLQVGTRRDHQRSTDLINPHRHVNDRPLTGELGSLIDRLLDHFARGAGADLENLPLAAGRRIRKRRDATRDGLGAHDV